MVDYRYVDGTRLTSVVEALIFSSEDPISWDHLAGIIGENDSNIQLDEVSVGAIVDQLNSRYEENDFAFRISEVGGGYTFATQPRYHPWLSIFQHENAYRKLSQSAIETLAIVAYRQPVTKPEVDQIRGVDSGYILRQLLEKVLVKVSGRADSPGKPLLYKTTDHFLKHFGLNSVDELPRPREIDEILRDDDMAEHRQLLMERQLELEEGEADEILNEFIESDKDGDGNHSGNEANEYRSEKDEDPGRMVKDDESDHSKSEGPGDVDPLSGEPEPGKESDADREIDSGDETKPETDSDRISGGDTAMGPGPRSE